MKKFIYKNSLSLVFLLLFIIAFAGQIFFGIKEYNKELTELVGSTVSLSQYFSSGHFLEATFENWESEFLQMALYVWLTIFLRQQGSSESKKLEGEEEVDREPDASKVDAPWPVKKGALYLIVYKNSLILSLFLLFILSFILHVYGSLKDVNTQNSLKGKPLETVGNYLLDLRLWFESFQNWQSEFLSIFAIIVLSIFLRQYKSPQSKPVDASLLETGR